MASNRLAFVALALACIAAAAGGGYLATRQNAVPTPASAAAAPALPTGSAPQQPSQAAPDRPVQETEAVVGDTPKKAPRSDALKPAARDARAKAETPRVPPAP